MNALATALLVYVALGATCWVVLAVAYVQIGLKSHGSPGRGLKRALTGLPIVLLWPLFVFGLIRRESRQRELPP